MESILSLKFQKSISDIEHKYPNILYIQWLIDIINDTVSYFVATEKKSSTAESDNDMEGIK